MSLIRKEPNKTILIVGGAGGIGKAAVELLLLRGHELVAADSNKEKLSALKTQERLRTVVMDLRKKDSVTQVLKEIKQSDGLLDAVVITAAVHSSYPTEYVPDAIVDEVLNVNLIAHIKFVRDALSYIKDGGRIVAVSSIAAGVGIPMESLYSASKAGLEMFYESLSAEVSYRGIKCSIVQPGNVNTGFNETGNNYRSQGNRFIDEGYKRILSKIDSRNGIQPHQVAKAVSRALESDSPSFCYVVGMNALKAHWAKRLLGRNLALKMMTKYFGLE